MPSPIETVIQHLGSAVALSTALGVTQQAISNWRRAGVPLDRCPAVERVSSGRIRCEQLRPDVEWQRDENGRVIGYIVRVDARNPAKQARAA